MRELLIETNLPEHVAARVLLFCPLCGNDLYARLVANTDFHAGHVTSELPDEENFQILCTDEACTVAHGGDLPAWVRIRDWNATLDFHMAHDEKTGPYGGRA
jgi:hypothetical protein